MTTCALCGWEQTDGDICPSCRAKLRQQNEVREMMSIHKDQFNDLMNRLKATGYELAAAPSPNWTHIGEMSRLVQGLHDILGDE